ncbi:MAG: molybdate ABC transporter substrate-binding protein [Aliihoeflea sp.]
MRRILAAVSIALCALVMPASAQEPVTVFAAASLKNALDAINESWSQEEGRTATISYAGSSALARQIEEGAPADLFISADLDWMANLAERALIDTQSERRLLGNRIVLVAPADATTELSIEPGFDLAGALGDGRLAMANVDAVPAGRYGKAALETLGVWDSVADKVAQAENVRAALQLVALGEAPLGIVYQTDATAEPDVRVVGTFPEDSHDPIIYPAALTAGGANPDAAAFLDYLQGGAARAIFEEQGFTVLAGN